MVPVEVLVPALVVAKRGLAEWGRLRKSSKAHLGSCANSDLVYRSLH